MSAFVYDLAQLIHGQKLAPVNILAHSLGGAIALRYAGIYPDKVGELIAIEGLGPSPKMIAERAERQRAGADARLDRAGARPRRPAAAPLRLDRGGAGADAGGEPAPHRGPGALPHRPRGHPERGRHLRLEVRQLRPLLLRRRPQPRRRWPSCGGRSPARPCWCTAQESWASNPAEDGRLGHFANARVSAYERAGHWVHHDRLDAFVAEARGFLSGGGP